MQEILYLSNIVFFFQMQIISITFRFDFVFLLLFCCSDIKAFSGVSGSMEEDFFTETPVLKNCSPERNQVAAHAQKRVTVPLKPGFEEKMRFFFISDNVW